MHRALRKILAAPDPAIAPVAVFAVLISSYVEKSMMKCNRPGSWLGSSSITVVTHVEKRKPQCVKWDYHVILVAAFAAAPPPAPAPALGETIDHGRQGGLTMDEAISRTGGVVRATDKGTARSSARDIARPDECG